MGYASGFRFAFGVQPASGGGFAIFRNGWLSPLVSFTRASGGTTEVMAGTELIANGDFSAGTTGWVSKGTSSLLASSNQLQATTTGAFAGVTNAAALNLTVGKRYVFSFDLVSTSSTVEYVLTGATVLGSAPTAGRYTSVFTATLASQQFHLDTAISSTFTIDNISVREIVQMQAAVNTPRYRYVNGFKELLIEGAATNLVFPSATATTQNITTTAQSHTLKFKGTGTVTKSGTASGALVGTGANNSVTQTFAATAGTLTLTVSGSVTEWQLEAGDIATSYIPTTSAAVTRAADIASIPTSAIGWNPVESTFVVEYTSAPLSSTTNWTAALVVGDAGSNSMYILNNLDGRRGVAGINGANCSATTVASGGRVKVAARYGAGAVSSSVNGLAVSSVSGNVIASNVHIGGGGYGALNSSIRALTYQPRALSNAELQAATA